MSNERDAESTSESPHVFGISDWRDRSVRMTRRTFENHLPRHPEITDYVTEVQEVIRDPDLVLEADNGAIYVYRYGIGRPPFPRLHLMAIVYYTRDGEGTVAPYFFTDEPARDARLLEIRAQVVAGQRFRTGQERRHWDGS